MPIVHIQESRQPLEQEGNDDDQRTPAENLGFSFDGLSPQDIDMKARRKASMDTLKLYSGNLASLSMPMDRLIETQPEKSPGHPPAFWRDGDDSSETSSEVNDDDSRSDDGSNSVGSLRPSSDTLSVSREMFLEATKDKAEQGTRNWRAVRMRRRTTMDKVKALRRHKASQELRS